MVSSLSSLIFWHCWCWHHSVSLAGPICFLYHLPCGPHSPFKDMNCNLPSCHSVAKTFWCCGTNSPIDANGAVGKKPDVDTESLSCCCCWMTFSLSSCLHIRETMPHPAPNCFFFFKHSFDVSWRWSHHFKLWLWSLHMYVMHWCRLIMYTSSFFQYAPWFSYQKFINRKTFIPKEWQLLFWHPTQLFVARFLCDFFTSLSFHCAEISLHFPTWQLFY